MSLVLGYKASAEQFGPRELLDFSVQAERLGLGSIAVSDHFQPWRHHGGHSPNALVWLGAVGGRTERAMLGTSVLTPTMRYSPSIVAQAFATLACLNPGRVFLGVGTGESLNETPATGAEWPGAKERRLRLAEAIELIKRLWRDERVTFEGDYYHTIRATIYDRPEEPLPIYVAASGPLAAKLAGRVGDGFIATSGKKQELYEELLSNLGEGAAQAGRDAATLPKFIEIKVSYDHDLDFAYDACKWWAALALTPEEKSGVEDPIEMERLADEAADRAHTRFIVSNDPDEVVEKIRWYVDLGFDHLVFHAPGEDQSRFLEQFCADVLPKLRELG
ncbi:MAG TPA: glucose-6-phosphate dehydrogenase (coenzyme-F420) [Gaiellaceae bacterium]|jgi:coenzyme F420-dependent glucose-6-phosphate dehydrogenase|nr:glucose-6-phosphate dehydrogenase (coenzyme-F420) [Gaiellaceae bacterium]